MRRPPSAAVLVPVLVAMAGCARHELPRPAALAVVSAPAPAAATPPMSRALAEPTRAGPPRGSRASSAVGQFVRERNAQLQLCYADARVAHADLAGTLTVALTLADDGRVADAAIERRAWSGDGAAIEGCVLGFVRRWRFPVPQADDARAHSFIVVFSGADAGDR